MADLTDIQAAQSVKIAGASTSGVESTFVKVSNNQDVGVADISDNGGVEGAISVSTSAVAVRVGGSNLTNRKTLTAFNNGTATVYWGYTSGVTTSTGTPIVKDQFASWAVGPNTTVYMIAAGGTQNVRVTESA